MVEFSADLGIRYYNKDAVRLRTIYRIAYEPGDIPYNTGGVVKNVYNRIAFDPDEVSGRLSDISPTVTLTTDKIAVGDIEIPLSEVY